MLETSGEMRPKKGRRERDHVGQERERGARRGVCGAEEKVTGMRRMARLGDQAKGGRDLSTGRWKEKTKGRGGDRKKTLQTASSRNGNAQVKRRKGVGEAVLADVEANGHRILADGDEDERGGKTRDEGIAGG